MFACAVGFSFQYGDVLGTRGESGERGRLWLPAPSLSARCVDTNPAGNWGSLYKGTEQGCCVCVIYLGL